MIGYNKSEIVGKMRERVILQNRIITQSDSGFQSEIYSDIGIYWSKIEYKTGFEEEDADKLSNQQKINITLRYNILVNVNSRFVYRNELYQVEKVEYSDDRRFMICVCVWRSSYTSIYAGSIFCSASMLAQSSLSAALMSVIKYQASLNAFGSVSADIALVQKVASSLNAFGTLTGDITFVKNMQASLLTSSSVTGNIIIPKLVQASLTGTGTTAANLTVNAPSASLLLDLYPNAGAAYSLRKLRAAYTGSAIRVRRSSDNTEQDIGFVADQLDTVSLLSFCGAGNGFVTTWYDQSGNARNATQTVLVSQPQIVSSGSLIFENGKVSVSYDGINDSLITSSYNFGNTNYSGFVVSKSGGLNNLGRAIYTIKTITPATNGYLHLIIRNNISNNFRSYYSSNGSSLNLLIQTPLNVFPVTQNLISNIVPTSGNITFNLNSIQQDIDSAIGQTLNDTIFVIGNYYTGPNVAENFYHEGTISELIIYMSNQQSNRTGIETNINTHYAIY